MNKIPTLLLCSFSLVLTACGGSSTDTTQLIEASQNLTKSAENFQSTSLKASSSLDSAYQKLDRATNQANQIVKTMEQRANISQRSFEQHTVALEKQLKQIEKTFIEANSKLETLEKLYISEGTVELTGEAGKLNLERFPATAQTECEFIEESLLDYNLRFLGRVQSNGVWVINGNEYKMLDKMTFQYSGTAIRQGSGTRTTALTSVTFKNTHDEIITTKRVKGYLLERDTLKATITLETRENGGKQMKFMPKGRECVLVLSQPLNLNLRQ